MEIKDLLMETLFLADATLSRRTGEQQWYADIVNEMADSIVSVITTSPEEQPYSITPDYIHLRNMITLFEEWKSAIEMGYLSYDEYDMQEIQEYHDQDKYFEQKIVSYLIKICYYWWIEDFNILDKIMRYYYESYKTYIEIYNAKIDENNAWDSLFEDEWWLNSTAIQIDSQTRNSPLLYFLMCYNYGSLTKYGTAFVNESDLELDENTPMCSDCFRLGNPEELRLLLQYGGRFSGAEYTPQWELELCGAIIDDMFDKMQKHLNRFVGMSKQEGYAIRLTKFWQKRLLCLRVMLRVMPQVNVCNFLERGNTTDLLSRMSEVFDIRCQPEEIANKLSNPRELKHLCRMRIRRMDIVSAMRCPFLPNGLKTLNLPQCLINYLNLLED